MKNPLQTASRSLAELSSTRTITVLGLLLAISIVLDFLTLQITPFLHISFQYLASSAAAMLFGPVVGGLFGVGSDLVCYLVNPKGPYFIGYTLAALAGGVVNGYILYGYKPTLPRVIASRVTMVVVFQIILNTFFSSILYSKAFWAILPLRAAKNVALLPVEVFLLFILLKKIYELRMKSGGTLAPPKNPDFGSR